MMNFPRAGLIAGAAAAIPLTGYFRSQVYGVAISDPRVYAASAVLLYLVAAAALWFPARRAMRVDPVNALRAD